MPGFGRDLIRGRPATTAPSLRRSLGEALRPTRAPARAPGAPTANRADGRGGGGTTPRGCSPAGPHALAAILPPLEPLRRRAGARCSMARGPPLMRGITCYPASVSSVADVADDGAREG